MIPMMHIKYRIEDTGEEGFFDAYGGEPDWIYINEAGKAYAERNIQKIEYPVTIVLTLTWRDRVILKKSVYVKKEITFRTYP